MTPAPGPGGRPRSFSSAVINKNGLRYLARCFASLLSSGEIFDRLIFVDDGSVDGSAAWVAENFPSVIVVRTHSGGPAAARNRAIEVAGGGLLLLLDCDAQLSPDCACRLAAGLVAQEALIALPDVLLPTGEIQHGAARTGVLGLACFENAWGVQGGENGSAPLSSCGGTALLLDLDRLPPDLRFDEQMRFGCEDGDFAFQAASRGFKIIHERTAAVTHLNPDPLRELSERAGYPKRKLFWQTRNRRWFVLKNFDLSTILLALPLHLAYEAAAIVLAAREGGLGGYVSGVFSFFFGVRIALRDRRRRLAVKKLRDVRLLVPGPLSLRPSVRADRAAALFVRCCAWWCRNVLNSPAPEDKRLNVLFLAPQPFYRLRGMCLAQKKCLEALSAAGCRVKLFAFPFGEDVQLPGLTISRLPELPFTRNVPIGFSVQKVTYDILLFFALAVNLPFKKYHVVHACEEAAVIAAFFRIFFDFRLVYDMDDVLSLRLKESGALRSTVLLWVVAAAERFALRRADSVLTNSSDTTVYAESVKGSGVFFYDHVPPIPEMVSPKSQGGTAPLITYAGNLEPYQGIGLLLEALAPVLAVSEARCLIIGGEPEQIAAYVRRAEILGISERVLWAGKLTLEETYSWLLVSSVLVSPVVEDKAVPSKIYMYMSAGRPIVATGTAGHASLLKDGSAFIVPASPGHLSGAILRALSDKPMAESLGRKARELFAAISAPGAVSGTLEKAYAGFGEHHGASDSACCLMKTLK